MEFEVSNTLIFPYRRNQKQFVCINNEFSTFKSIELDVHQRSILEPLLFLVYINDLPLSLHSVPRLVANDTAFCINDNSPENLEILANQKLKNISSWVVSNGLIFHSSKIQVLNIASFTHKSSPSLSFNLCKNIINIINTVKYLSIDNPIDNQLYFTSHINFLRKSCLVLLASWLN